MPITVWVQAAAFMSGGIITSLLTGLLLKTGFIFDSGYAIPFHTCPFSDCFVVFFFFCQNSSAIYYLFNKLFFSLIQPMSIKLSKNPDFIKNGTSRFYSTELSKNLGGREHAVTLQEQKSGRP